MRINKKRKQLEDALTQAKRTNDYIQIVKLNRQLEELSRQEAVEERTSLYIATRNMSNEFRKDIDKAVIGCVVAADILQNQLMILRSHTIRIPDYDVLINAQLKHIIKSLGDIVRVIDDTSNNAKPINHNGRLIPLSEHYMQMVDQVEAKMYGWQNIINKVVDDNITFDGHGNQHED